MEIGDKIKKRRLELGYTVEQIAEILGKNRSTIYRYENNEIENLPTVVLEMLAKALKTTPVDLMGWDENFQNKYNNPKDKKNVKIPVLGKVIAGIPIEAIEDIIDYEEISSDIAALGEYFALKVKGNSMEPRICENDVLIVKKQNNANSGEIVIALIDGENATCKKFIRHNDGISLVSFNPLYEPIYFSNKDVVNKPVKIIGKVIENRQKY